MAFRNTAQLHAGYLRRREIENQRNERVQAVSNYFDHWGKVNSRYENWTTPEYYELANKKLDTKKEKERKTKQLIERRDKLRNLLENEKILHDQALETMRRPVSSKKKVRLEVLQKVNSNLKLEEDIRKKLDLEAKLYGKWRHGVDDDSLLFDSKSQHETLAKLNWLDKQVNEQMQREKDEEAAMDRQLRMQADAAKAEELRKERHMIIEREIKELRAMQANSLEELKVRTNESDMLQEKVKTLNQHLIDLEKELELLNNSSLAMFDIDKLKEQQNCSLKNVKSLLRKRSKDYSEQLRLTIDILTRLRWYISDGKKIEELLNKYRRQFEEGALALERLDAMYESEAKNSLQCCEEAWQTDVMDRYDVIKKIIQDELPVISEKLDNAMKRQEEVLKIRDHHLDMIDTTNKKLKELVLEDKTQVDKYDNMSIGDRPSTQSLGEVSNHSFGQTLQQSASQSSGQSIGDISSGSLGKPLEKASEQLLGQSLHKPLVPATLGQPIEKSSEQSLGKALTQASNETTGVNLGQTLAESLRQPTGKIKGSGESRLVLPINAQISADNISIYSKPSKTRLAAPFACSSTTPSAESDSYLKTTGRRRFPSRTSMPVSETDIGGPLRITESFKNLNMDVYRTPSNLSIDNPKTETQESLSFQSSKHSAPPKFARKRIAWT